MRNKNSLSVAVIGIPEHEQGVLKRIFTLTLSRSRSYVLVHVTPNKTPDIFLVDGDNQDAVNELCELCASDAAHSAVPTVMVSKAGGVPEPQVYHLQRPLLAPRVLKTLDEIEIGGSDAPAGTRRPSKALVVDDSETVRRQVELELTQLGISADFAENAEEAFAYLKRLTSYDIIFLDVVLPDVDGYTICKTIKKHQRHKRTPVVMLTGKGSPFDRVRGKLAGCDTYLTKPVSREAFHAAVKTYLSRQAHKEEVFT